MVSNVLVVGATGLVGSHLVELLIKDERFDLIHIFVRNKTEYSHSKIIEYIVDFENLEYYFQNINVSIIYCCIGTTIKIAGTQRNFEKVDFDIPISLALIAKANKINSFVVVSSIGANANSSSFYLRTKGKMEKELINIGISNTKIFRPSMLLGKRKENRILEKIGSSIFTTLAPLLLGNISKYRPIHAKILTKSMINITTQTDITESFFEWKEIIRISKIS